MKTSITSNFDSGNIIVDDCSSPQDIRLRIRNDTQSDFKQWFHFRLHTQKGIEHTLKITNAGECSYSDGWHGYQCVASYDRKTWFRIPTTHYDGKELTISVTPQQAIIWFAYFEPYSYERHQELIAICTASPYTYLEELGTSIQGRGIDCIHLASDEDKPNVWIVARQHPGESMGEWFVEGLLERLLDPLDSVASEIRKRAHLYIVPNINPDGAVLGNLRSNAAGVNLNREWLNPSLEKSPEVWHVRTAMKKTGVNLFLDIHGDETLPCVFIDGSHMVPDHGERNIALQKTFLQNLLLASPDFQLEQGYAEDRFTDELLTLASKWVAHNFACPSMTLEMPFKDSAHTANPCYGWNGERSRKLGAAMLYPILSHLQQIAL